MCNHLKSKGLLQEETGLVFKTDTSLLNSRNSLDSYNNSYACLCACSFFGKMLLEMPVELFRCDL